MESWQSTPLPVEWILLVLDLPGLQHAVGLGVAVGVDHYGPWIDPPDGWLVMSIAYV